MNESKSASVLFRQIFYILQLKEVHNERTLFENYQHEYICKLAYPGCADTQACFEESSQVGQCSALGYRGCQIDLPALF